MNKPLPRTIAQLPRKRWLASTIGALFAASALALSPHAQARVFLSVNVAPPLLPVYEQPPIPGPGYVWTPGYWAYGDDGYYWVPGAWVAAPYTGALWTPGYWGWDNSAYVFHDGYWGLHVGYYGGIDYGFGYTGMGYYGGYWNHGAFFYNTAFNRFGGVHITNVYNRTVVDNFRVNRFSFNGPGGVRREETREELAAAHERHMAATRAQIRDREMASRDASMRASVNHGTPPVAAIARAGEFRHDGMARDAGSPRTSASAHGLPYAERARAARDAAAHARESRHAIAHAPAHVRETAERDRFRTQHTLARTTRQTEHRHLVAEHVNSVHAHHGATASERARFKAGNEAIGETARHEHRAAVSEHTQSVHERDRVSEQHSFGPPRGSESHATARPMMHSAPARGPEGRGGGPSRGGNPKDRGNGRH